MRRSSGWRYLCSHWWHHFYCLRDMASGMVFPRSCKTWESGSAKEEGWFQAARHTIGQETVGGNSSSWGKGSAQSHTESRWLEEVCRSRNTTTGGRDNNREGRRGPSNVLAGVGSRGNRNSRRQCGPRDYIHIVKVPTHYKESRTQEEGQGLKIGHWPDHLNRRWSAWHQWDGMQCHKWGSSGFYAREPDCVGGP